MHCYRRDQKAKREGHAALERFHGESAALRNLANAAFLLDKKPALQNLGLRQSFIAVQNTGTRWCARRLRASEGRQSRRSKERR